MADVRPFRGFRYDLRRVGKMEDVVVPPYDVISDTDLIQMRRRHEYNYSKIILSDGENRHRKAATLLSDWRAQGVIRSESRACFYFYQQMFQLTDEEQFCLPKKSQFVRQGFFACVKLQEYADKVIFPHEHTFAGPKEDRYELMKAARGQLEPVFFGYEGQRFSGAEFDKAIGSQEPVVFFTDQHDVQHKLWAISQPDIVDAVVSALREQSLYILDGHHRYETALQFSKDFSNEAWGKEAETVMACLCPLAQSGTVILPTHRLLRGIDPTHIEQFWRQFEKRHWLRPMADLRELEAKLMSEPGPAYGVRRAGDGQLFLLATGEKSNELGDLNVLHHRIIPQLGDSHPDISYVKAVSEWEQKLQSGHYQLGFLVRPTPIDEVIETAHAGQPMPHKSTFFYPKIPSGLVSHLFD